MGGGESRKRRHEEKEERDGRGEKIEYLPGQILGPPLKGKKLNPGNNPSQRSGRNSSASLPQRSVRRCME